MRQQGGLSQKEEINLGNYLTSAAATMSITDDRAKTKLLVSLQRRKVAPQLYK